MLKYCFIVVISLMNAGLLKAQSLQGNWKGSYTALTPKTDVVNVTTFNDISLDISVNSDSTYSITSISVSPYDHGDITKHKCSVQYYNTGSDLLLINEIKVLDPANGDFCLKHMSLQIIKRKKKIELVGAWYTTSPTCNDRGDVRFYKKIDSPFDK